MSELQIQTDIEKAVECFDSPKCVMMSPLELSKIVELDLSIFDATCQFYFLKSSLKAIQRGKLTLIFKQHKNNIKTQIKNSRIYIGSKSGYVTIYCRGHSFCLIIGQDSTLGRSESKSFEIKLSRKSTVIIGERTTCNSGKLYSSDCYIKIGRDCLFSTDILIQGNDGHAIVDLKQGLITNFAHRSIEIEDHVWLGRRVMILPDAKIGEGSIIGAGSIVTKKIEPRSIAVGTPARSVKKDFTWSRQSNSFDEYSRQAISSYCENHSSTLLVKSSEDEILALESHQEI